MDIQGLQESLGVGMGRFITHHQSLGDLPITEATGEQIKHLIFALGKPGAAQVGKGTRAQGWAAIGVAASTAMTAAWSGC